MKEDFIFGLRPVIEAIEAGKTIDKIFLQNGLQGPIYADLKALLSKHKIRPNFVPVEKLNRFTPQKSPRSCGFYFGRSI